jgi:hypothetical protein
MHHFFLSSYIDMLVKMSEEHVTVDVALVDVRKWQIEDQSLSGIQVPMTNF